MAGTTWRREPASPPNGPPASNREGHGIRCQRSASRAYLVLDGFMKPAGSCSSDVVRLLHLEIPMGNLDARFGLPLRNFFETRKTMGGNTSVGHPVGWVARDCQKDLVSLKMTVAQQCNGLRASFFCDTSRKRSQGHCKEPAEQSRGSQCLRRPPRCRRTGQVGDKKRETHNGRSPPKSA